jgi:hypothetical protein
MIKSDAPGSIPLALSHCAWFEVRFPSFLGCTSRPAQRVFLTALTNVMCSASSTGHGPRYEGSPYTRMWGGSFMILPHSGFLSFQTQKTGRH